MTTPQHSPGPTENTPQARGRRVRANGAGAAGPEPSMPGQTPGHGGPEKSADREGTAALATPPSPPEELSEFEAAVAGPEGIETAAPDLSPDTDEEALAEIEEAISDADDDDALEVEEVHVSYPVRKPHRSKKRFEFFMTHPDQSLWVKAWVVIENLDMDEEYFLVTDNVRGELADHLSRVEFIPCITSRGRVFVWPIPCEDATGRKNKWTQSARGAAADARAQLTKILSDKDEGKYRVFHPKNAVEPPEWPADFTRKTMLARMFKDHILRDLDNDVAREFLNAGRKIER
jgi:hypothetical protein